MNFAFELEHISTFAFLLGAPCLLAARILLPTKATWWRIAILSAIWGSITAFLAILFDRLWLDKFDADLPPGVIAEPSMNIGPFIFAALTGNRTAPYSWILGLAYFALCIPVYALLRLLLNRAREPVRAAQHFTVMLLFISALAFPLSYFYESYVLKHFPNMNLDQLKNRAAAVGAVLCWFCTLCVVSSSVLSVALLRRRQRLGALFIGCALVMALLAFGLL